MNDTPFYENLNLNSVLPVNINKHNNDASGTGCAFHWHEAIEIYYVIKGSLKVNSMGNIARLKGGDIGLIGWSHPHRGLAFENGTVHYILQIDVSKIPGLARYGALQTPGTLPTFIFQDRRLAGILDRIIDEYEKKGTGYDLNVTAGFFNFFAIIMRDYITLSRSQTSPKSLKSLVHVHEILKMLNNDYKNISSLEALARELGLSREYMCRIFKEHTGHTIITHLNEQRCHYAASLILEGRPLSEASELAGFHDYNYFSRVFKKTMESPPSEYINSKERGL